MRGGVFEVYDSTGKFLKRGRNTGNMIPIVGQIFVIYAAQGGPGVTGAARAIVISKAIATVEWAAVEESDSEIHLVLIIRLAA